MPPQRLVAASPPWRVAASVSVCLYRMVLCPSSRDTHDGIRAPPDKQGSSLHRKPRNFIPSFAPEVIATGAGGPDVDIPSWGHHATHREHLARDTGPAAGPEVGGRWARTSELGPQGWIRGEGSGRRRPGKGRSGLRCLREGFAGSVKAAEFRLSEVSVAAVRRALGRRGGAGLDLGDSR